MKTLWQKFWNRIAQIGWQDENGFHFGPLLITIMVLLCGCASQTPPGNVPPNPPVLVPPSPTAMTETIQRPVAAVIPAMPVEIQLTCNNPWPSNNWATVIMGSDSLSSPNWQTDAIAPCTANVSVWITVTNSQRFWRAINIQAQIGL